LKAHASAIIFIIMTKKSDSVAGPMKGHFSPFVNCFFNAARDVSRGISVCCRIKGWLIPAYRFGLLLHFAYRLAFVIHRFRLTFVLQSPYPTSRE
jgi:hypothetical protein